MHLRFAEFTLDTESRLLLRDNAERHLSPKAFDLLSLLLQSRPRALSKAELHERLWPATFVSDATLSSLVAEVRAALGENAHQGRFVRTVHRFGYAFQGSATDLQPHKPAPHEGPRCWVIWDWGRIALDPGDHLLGRAADVAVWLESPTVSRHHARVHVRGPDVTIEDLSSKNGTFLGGHLVTKPTLVADGDEIELGSVRVKVRLFDPSGSTETRPSGDGRRRKR